MNRDATPMPPLLRQGFRLFFLGAAAWAALAMAIFVASLSGVEIISPALGAVDWHVHEFLFGYTGAVIAGFLLTAVPNWTRRLPVSGGRLLFLFALWIAGRVALAFSANSGALLVAAVDLAFPAWLIFVIARELIAGRNYKNLRVLALVMLFASANAGYHYEIAAYGTGDYSRRAGIAVILLLIMLIGGRIIPSFTRNWLVQKGSNLLPVPFGRYDGLTILASAAAFLTWIAAPQSILAAIGLGLTGLLNLVRMARWKGWQTFSESLVVILHVAYAFIPAGMIALALSIVIPDRIPPAGALHLLTAGAIGMMTLAVMTRASLGHTGQKLHADGSILAIYAALTMSVILRFGYATVPNSMLLVASGSLWILAFALFSLRYAYMAVR
ncbi:NnrS family protein [Oricola sp.]|uniref:NnrS family protein n=1 Tax=Oricola sp. TaxID=1979950 RepID=UPI0025D593F1|nr:NnrS family protein [Oricola sp.]MCI5073981.1 NnrS family protein [Oricola sp.]